MCRWAKTTPARPLVRHGGGLRLEVLLHERCAWSVAVAVEGEGCAEVRAVRAVDDAEGAVVGGGDAVGDGQTEAGAHAASRVRAASRRVKRSKTLLRCSTGMPGPSSRTFSTARSPSALGARRMVTVLVAWRSALSRRLASTRVRSMGAPWTLSGSGAVWTASVRRRAAAWRTASWRTTPARSTGWNESRAASWGSRRARSSRSVVRCWSLTVSPRAPRTTSGQSALRG